MASKEPPPGKLGGGFLLYHIMNQNLQHLISVLETNPMPDWDYSTGHPVTLYPKAFPNDFKYHETFSDVPVFLTQNPDETSTETHAKFFGIPEKLYCEIFIYQSPPPTQTEFIQLLKKL